MANFFLGQRTVDKSYLVFIKTFVMKFITGIILLNHKGIFTMIAFKVILIQIRILCKTKKIGNMIE